MNNVAVLQKNFSGAQLDLIRRTVASDCDTAEFDLFIAAAQRAQLDPLRKQISALVFNKKAKDQSKRRMAIVTTIDGLRAIAARSLRYRPDDEEPDFTYDPDAKSDLNPLGLVRAKVNVYIRDAESADWRRVPGVAYWDEFVPIEDVWGEDERTGKWGKTGGQKLSDTWKRMGRLMLAKCAEAQALRKAFPEDLSGLYAHEEFDRAQVVDVTASEIVEQHQTDERLERIGAAGITFQLTPASPLEPIPLGQVADRIIEAAEGFSLQQIRWFRDANTHPLREYWARAKGDALELKKRLDEIQARLEADA